MAKISSGSKAKRVKKQENDMFGVQKQQLKKLTSKEYEALRMLCHLSKNMYNVGLFNVRQHFFDTQKYLSYANNYNISKTNENYAILNKNMAQQTLKSVDEAFKSFFALNKKKKEGSYTEKVRIPKYLDKENYYQLTFAEFSIKNGVFAVPMAPAFKKQYGKVLINVPKNLLNKNIKEVKIIPKNDAKFFEIQYTYLIKKEELELNENNALSIDLGIDNFATCVSTLGEAFIIDGKAIKCINQWANKNNARLQSIKDKQKIEGSTKAQFRIWNKRNNQVNDYLNKAIKHIINHCLNNNIGKVVLGYNPNFQKDSNLGNVNNQKFVNLPYGLFKSKLESMCERYNIKFITTEESYTSKASFFDNDELPVFDAKNNKNYKFSGRRIERGLYKTKTGMLVNADINGALNILRKLELEVKNINQSIFNPRRVFVLRDKNQLGNKIKQKIKNIPTANVNLKPSAKIERPKKQFNIKTFSYTL